MASTNSSGSTAVAENLNLVKFHLTLPNVVNHYRKDAVERVHVLPIPPNRLPWLAAPIKDGGNVFERNTAKVFLYYEAACKRLAVSGHTSEVKKLQDRRLRLEAVVEGLSKEMVSVLQNLEHYLDQLDEDTQDMETLRFAVIESMLFSYLEIETAIDEEAIMEDESSCQEGTTTVHGVELQASNSSPRVTSKDEMTKSNELKAAPESTLNPLDSSLSSPSTLELGEPALSVSEKYATFEVNQPGLMQNFSDSADRSLENEITDNKTQSAIPEYGTADEQNSLNDESFKEDEAIDDEEGTTDEGEEDIDEEGEPADEEEEEEETIIITEMSEEDEQVLPSPGLASQEHIDEYNNNEVQALPVMAATEFQSDDSTHGKVSEVEMTSDDSQVPDAPAEIEQPSAESLPESSAQTFVCETPTRLSPSSSQGNNFENLSDTFSVEHLLERGSPATPEELEFMIDFQLAEDYLNGQSDEDYDENIIHMVVNETKVPAETIGQVNDKSLSFPEVEEIPAIEEQSLLEDGAVPGIEQEEKEAERTSAESLESSVSLKNSMNEDKEEENESARHSVETLESSAIFKNSETEDELNMPGAYSEKPVETQLPQWSTRAILATIAAIGIPTSIIYPTFTAIVLCGVIRYVRHRR